MNINNIVNLCRLCLEPGKESEKVSVFAKSDSNETLSIAEKIMLCSEIKLFEIHSQKLPNKICGKCLNLLDSAYEFYKLTQRSNTILNDLIENSRQNDINFLKSILNNDDSNESEEFGPLEITLNNGKIYKVKNKKLKPYNTNSNQKPITIPHPPELIIMPKTGPIEFLKSENEIKKEIDDIGEEMEIKNIIGEKKENNDGVNDDMGKFIEDLLKDTSNSSDSSDNDDKFFLSEIFKMTPKISVKSEESDPHKYMCEVCGKICTKSTALRSHLKVHSGELENRRIVDCEVCGKRFVNNSVMLKHLRKHSGIKPFKCTYCHRTFSENKSRKLHERTHTGERPYKCEVCDKAFTYSHGLKKHKIVHTGLKMFRCDICDKNFGTKHHLKQHQLTIYHKKAESESSTIKTEK